MKSPIERITDYINKSAEGKQVYLHKIGTQGIFYEGKLIYMLKKNNNDIEVVYFQGSLQSITMPLEKCTEDMLRVIADNVTPMIMVNSLYNLIAD